MPDPETELMLRVAQGEVAAFTPLVQRVLPRLLGYFRRLGADAAQAEDCAQEVLLRVYRHRERYVARARFVTYLFHVARNHWIDVYRHQRAGPTMISADASKSDEGEGLVRDLEGAPSEPDRGALGRELRAAVDRAIEGLSPEHREVFVLAQVDGLRYQEIGEILRVPVGTVKSRMHTAVRQVRQALARSGFEP